MSEQSRSDSKIVLTPTQKQKIHELHAIYDQADRLVSEVEEFIGEAGIPALNEMRYAGYHLAHSILLRECKFCDDQINSAVNHCKRACYEASEAGIVIALLKFREFRNDYKTIVITEVLKEWPNIQKDFRNAQKGVNNGRAKGEDDRSADYDVRMSTFRKLSTHCETLECVRDDLNSKVADSVSNSRRFIIGAGLTLLGIIIASVFSYFQLTKDKGTPTDSATNVINSIDKNRASLES